MMVDTNEDHKIRLRMIHYCGRAHLSICSEVHRNSNKINILRDIE